MPSQIQDTCVLRSDSARALLHVGFQTTALRTVFLIDFRFDAVDFRLRSMREFSNDDWFSVDYAYGA
jgi:hypothetical protein